MLSITSLAARFGPLPAVVEPESGTTLSYEALAWRALEVSSRIGKARKLVLVEASNDLSTLIAYLGALEGGHPVLLAPAHLPAAVEALQRAIDPDVVVRPGSAGPVLEFAHADDRSRHDLHPELAMLSSTSGSTGSPKLVRLSAANLASNADAIASYLELSPDDRACTSLPMHYCYGLSVINSHLVRGASICLTDRSVLDPMFFESFVATGSTNFAGVPHTFDLLERSGDGWMDLPGLRHVTQAGGRLAPDHVRRLALAAADRAWRFFVMYGQTEATARMAYLPPHLAADHPAAIGQAVPGGSLDLEPIDGSHTDDVGELVYRGPNVMLGYAESSADLALGRTVETLRTGDLARRNEAGLFEIVGRINRFVKIFGVRLDLDRIEQVLAEEGFSAACAGDDERLVIACTDHRDAPRIAALIANRFHLPASRIAVHTMDELPRSPSGKVDYTAILRSATTKRNSPDTTRRVFESVFPHQKIEDNATFLSLGGDSLTYVELSVRLEEALGHLPEDWPTTPLHLLEAGVGSASEQPARERAGFIGGANRKIETGILLRALAIVAVVSSHAGLFRVRGGGHVLLAIAGYNFARFHLSAARATGSGPRLARSITRIALPAVAWMAVLLATTDDYSVANFLLINNQLGPSFWDQRWRYWYVEALVQILAVAATVFAIPAVRRAERRDPFRVALVVFGVAIGLRLLLHDAAGLSRSMHRPQTVVWLFALGWLAQTAGRDRRRQALVGALAVAFVPGFFVNDQRSALVVGAIALLLVLPRIALPSAIVRIAGPLASASLSIYLTHWQVYPALAAYPAFVGVTASLLVGVSLSALARRVRSHWASWAAADATVRVPAGSGLRVRSPRAA